MSTRKAPASAVLDEGKVLWYGVGFASANAPLSRPTVILSGVPAFGTPVAVPNTPSIGFAWTAVAPAEIVSVPVVAPLAIVTLGAVMPIGGEFNATVTAPVKGGMRVIVTVVGADFPRSMSRVLGFTLTPKPPVAGGGGGCGVTVKALVAEYVPMVPFAPKSPDTTSVCGPTPVISFVTLLLFTVVNVGVIAVPSSETSGCGRTEIPSHCTSTSTSQLTPAASLHAMLA
jgi:hypothetical protein